MLLTYSEEIYMQPHQQEGETLHSMVQFAIEKEQEAIHFYENLAQKAKVKSIQEELLKIKAMEEQHKEKLKRFDLEILEKSTPKKMLDLKIADYVVETKVSVEMSWQDIINVAMHRELAAMKLYQVLSQRLSDPKVVQFFQHLASEESAHKLFFEKLWDEEVLKEN